MVCDCGTPWTFLLPFCFNVGLKSLPQQGLSQPEFYGVLVYKLRKYMLAMVLALNFVKSFFDI